MLHSIDHDAVKGDDSKEYQELAYTTAVREMLWRLEGALAEEQREIVFDAVMRHDLKTPGEMTPVLQVLREADMLANMAITCVIRGGQFRPDLPAFEVEHLEQNNPRSTYGKPCSVLDAVRNTLDCQGQIKLPKAIPIAKERAFALRGYVETVKQQYR